MMRCALRAENSLYRLSPGARQWDESMDSDTLTGLLRAQLGRSILMALVVGSALVLINHGDHLAKEPICHGFVFKTGLSYLVPFLVSMVSAALAHRDA